jgi:hypothetical protein
MASSWVVVGHPRELSRNYLIHPMAKDPIMQYATSKY